MKEITTGIYQLTDEDLDRVQESVKCNVEEVFGDKADKLEGYRVSLKPLAGESDGSGDGQGWTPHIIRTYGMEATAADEPPRLTPRQEYRLRPQRLPRKEKKRRKKMQEMRLVAVASDGKWATFANKCGAYYSFPIANYPRIRRRLQLEMNRIRKGGGRKCVL